MRVIGRPLSRSPQCVRTRPLTYELRARLAEAGAQYGLTLPDVVTQLVMRVADEAEILLRQRAAELMADERDTMRAARR